MRGHQPLHRGSWLGRKRTDLELDGQDDTESVSNAAVRHDVACCSPTSWSRMAISLLDRLLVVYRRAFCLVV